MDTPLIAAMIAAAAAVFAALMAWTAAGRARRSSDRTHAWTRLVWIITTSGDLEHDISERVLASMHDLRWAPADDRALAAELLERARSTASRTEGEPPC